MKAREAWRRLKARGRQRPEDWQGRMRRDYDRRVRAAQALCLSGSGGDGAWLAWRRVYDARARFLARHRCAP